MLRIAITKGRIKDSTIELLENSGFDVDILKNPGRKLLLKTKDDIEYVVLKSKDVINFVNNESVDLGIVGLDMILENYKNNIKEIGDFENGKCKFSLASIPNKNLENGMIIATKYPKIAKAYCRRKNIEENILEMDGGIELAPLLGNADAIIDIVETGKTLKENGLEIKEDLFKISTRVITNNTCLNNKSKEIDEFMKKINIKNLIKEDIER